MPNWCFNYVEVSHDNPRKMLGLIRAFRQGRMLSYVCPVPKDLYREGASSFGGDNAEGYDQIRLENLEKYGYGNWYDFCVAKWGTKWDVGDRFGVGDWDRHSAAMEFDSAWGPPIAAYQLMETQGYRVTAKYHESGMAYVGTYEDGYDNCINYSDENADTVRSVIGDELDDFFAISENLAAWEDGDAEELTEWLKDGIAQREDPAATRTKDD